MTSSHNLSRSQTNKPFQLVSKYQPSGDQPKVIDFVARSLEDNNFEQTILGATGTGKTFMMAKVVEKLQRPTLVIAHNKTLAAQLAEEFRRFFPDNAVHYFVSYYDYYQPESYIPKSDTYIEKQTQINEEIERLRNASTQALLTRKDVLIVASVSCIYGLGDPEDFDSLKLEMEAGQRYRLPKILRRLVELQFSRTNMDLKRGTFRVRGDTLEIYPTSEDQIAYRFSFFGDELEQIESFNTISNQSIEDIKYYTVFPAKQYVTTQEKINRAISEIRQDLIKQVEFFEKEGKVLQAHRIRERTQNDIEMLETLGFVGSIENYSIYFENRQDGDPPATLLDYFPDNFICFIDESHITLPQIAAMYNGDRSRKTTLVEYGFRLPSALNNRPLKINEFFERANQLVYVSATPGAFEQGKNNLVGKNEVEFRANKSVNIPLVEAIIRPTGLIDPLISVKPVGNQVDDILEQVRKRINKGQRVLITTLTKKFAEELDLYFKQINIKSAYIHSDVDTLERVEVLSDLRRGRYDVLIGINLLREGLDLPEVSLVAIFDADKEGFLRSRTSLIQIIGRAARHLDGQVIMYADRLTDSMKAAIEETERRRSIQIDYNQKNGIIPESTKRDLEEIVDITETEDSYTSTNELIEENNSLDESFVKIKRGSKRRVPRGKQVYTDFEINKEAIMQDLQIQGLSKIELEKVLAQAVEKTDFERAAAARDLLASMP